MLTIIKKRTNSRKKIFFHISMVLLIAFSVLLLSCSRGEVRPEDVLVKNNQTGNTQVSKYNRQLAARAIQAARSGPSSSDYSIGPEDLLEISVFQVDEIARTVRVSGNGYIGMPLIGRVKAAGLTSSGLETFLAKKLGRYLQSPMVSVFIKEYRSQPISVIGAVKTPKVYYATGSTHLLDVLAMAGGLAPEAGNVCVVERVASEGKSQKQIVIDLTRLLGKGDISLDIPLKAGDVINVPEGGVFFVDGGVRAPGSYPIKGASTLTQAITMAKGFGFEAEKDKINIYRDNGKSKRDVIPVNYNDIINGKVKDIYLQDRDIIIVAKSGFKSLIKGISTSLSFGGFGLSRYPIP